MLEVAVAILCLAFSVWALPRGSCTGRLFGEDCEAWYILTTWMFAPIGLLALVCAIWSLRSRSITPHVVLLVGFAATTIAFVVVTRA